MKTTTPGNLRFNGWAWAALALGLFCSALGAWLLARSNEQQARGAMQQEAQRLTDTVLARIQLYQYGLRGARGAVITAGEDGISRALFHRYSQTRALDEEFVGARGFGFIRRVAESDEVAFLRQAREDDAPEFVIRQLSPHSGERYVIQYIEPQAPNRAAIGLDIASESNRRRAAIESMRTGQVRLTGPITLVQASGETLQSFLMLMPIYRGGVTPSSIEQREQEAFGWSFAPLLMRDVLGNLQLDDAALHVQLADVTDSTPGYTFFASNDDARAPRLFSQTLQREVFGRRWQIDFSAHPPFIARLHQVSPALVFGLGALASLLLAALLGAVSVSRRRRNRIVEEQARLAAIVASSADAIIGITLQGTISSWNAAARQLFGYRDEEAVGYPVAQLLVPAEMADEETRILAAVASGKGVPSFDTQRLHRDGRRIDVAVSVSPVLGPDGRVVGASKTLRDISAQKAAAARIHELNSNLELQVAARTAELHETNLLLSSVLRSASELSIIAVDVQGTIRIFNQGAERMLGYRAEEMIGLHTPECLHVEEELTARAEQLAAELGPHPAGFRTLALRAERDGAEVREWTYVRKDGSRFPVKLMVTAIRDDNGTLTGYLGIATDITRERELQDSLRQAKEQADAANAAKSSFLANMSHEIRTPMNAVLGMLYLTQETELNSRQRDYVDKAYAAASALLGLLNDILDYSKIEAGKLQLDLHPFEPETLLRDLAVVLSGNLGDKDLEVLFDIDPALPGRLLGDALRLQQILINLAGNAIKFTERGQVVVSVRMLHLDGDRLTLRIAVSDSGIGISAEQLQRIFESFTQAESSTARRFGGTGLGLFICKRLVELMGGELQVDSRLGVGSRFWFDLPLPVVEAAPARPVTARPNPALRLLIADDNASAGELLVRTCEALGWQADLVGGGLHAVLHYRQARSLGVAYDVVLMDWRMPDLDGLQAARQIQRDAPTTAPPTIIMITAYGREVLADELDNADPPFVDFLTKPVTPRQLADSVRLALGEQPLVPVAARTKPKRLAGRRLLVVEDNALNRQVAAELLASEGASVLLAEGGLDGVNLVCNAAAPPDAVLMDMRMPDIDGLEATRRIRADGRFAELPIIAMTANASQADRQACLAAGMNEHIAKPIDKERLVSCLLAQLGVPPGAAETRTPRASGGIVESREAVLDRFGGDERLIVRVLKTFGPEMEKLLARLEQQQLAGDPETLAGTLHTLKGSAGTMGASALSEHAARLEADLLARAAENSQAGLDPARIQELRHLLGTSLVELRAQFGAVDAPPLGR